MDMLVVIPAGGLGRRFAPLSRVVPKELLPLGDKPLIHHALEEAARAGFDQAVIVISPAKQDIERYFEIEGKPSELAGRLRLRFVRQTSAAGLGDAVLRGASLDSSGPIGVLLPDDVVPSTSHWESLLAVHRATGAAAFCVRAVAWEDTHRFGIAVGVPEGHHLRVRELVEKPAPGTAASNLSVFGRYIVTAGVLDALTRLSTTVRGELQLTDGFAAVAGADPGVMAVEFGEVVYDCGTPDEYARSVARFSRASEVPC